MADNWKIQPQYFEITFALDIFYSYFRLTRHKPFSCLFFIQVFIDNLQLKDILFGMGCCQGLVVN